MKILLGTSNQGKVLEMKAIIASSSLKDAQIMTLKDVPHVDEPIEDGSSFWENARIKAKYYFERFHIPVICDDSGLVIEALDGRPGIMSARYANGRQSHQSFANIQQVLEEMKHQPNRSAYFTTVLVYYDGSHQIAASGKVEGMILKEMRGNNGFGYDPIFFLPSYQKTMAELSEQEKNQISHRQRALSALIEKMMREL